MKWSKQIKWSTKSTEFKKNFLYKNGLFSENKDRKIKIEINIRTLLDLYYIGVGFKICVYLLFVAKQNLNNSYVPTFNI